MKNFVFAMFLPFAVFAALPPLAESIKEIQSILSDPKLYERLGSAEIIEHIDRSENGFVVTTRNYRVDVDVVYTTHRFIGPAKFELQFHEPVRK